MRSLVFRTVLAVLITAARPECSITFQKQYNILSNTPTTSMHLEYPGTLSQCATACTSLITCQTFMFDKSTKQCNAIDVSVSDFLSTGGNDSTMEAYLPRVDALVAQGKPAEIVSTYGSGWPAGMLVDGIYIPDSGVSSMAHSHEETNPWWRVDLEDTYCIWAVRILNRVDGFYGRSRNAYITVAEDVADIFYNTGSNNNICAYHDGVLNRYYTLIRCQPIISGQIVQIQFITVDYLNLYEVEVHAVL